MVEEIFSNLYRIEVPLPRNPLQAINSYVIKDGDRCLIIDTGMNRPECLSVMSAGLKELDIDLAKADFFITHNHSDHLGLVSSLVTEKSTIYFNRPEANSSSKAGSSWGRNADFADRNGFPEEERKQAIDNHPGRKYSPQGHLDFHVLGQGDTIRIGGYSLNCIETPGHTRGHMCLYEPDKKLFFSGDHILIDITPNISLTSDDENPLQSYLDSLDKIYNLDIEMVLPGHRRRFRDHRARIDELKLHHEARASEVIAILEEGDKNAYQVASQMTWDMTYESWDLFPPQQKWFAFAEAAAHLKYVEEKGEVEKQTQDQIVIYALKK
ncbi:MAG: MBL fold metallo-hydrolase [Dehalococcoidales bacterium]|nr:MBL fold metallo-hydrolase [Dehalococcoidales bacterium]